MEKKPGLHRLPAGGRRIRTIGPAPAKGSSGRCQSETAARKAEPLTGSGPKRQCLPGVAAHSLSLRGGTASSNPSSSSEESIANLTFGGSSAAGGDVSGTKGQHMLDQGGPDVLMSKRSSRSRRYRSRQRRGCSSTHRLPAVAFEVARGPSSLACGIYSHIDAI